MPPSLELSAETARRRALREVGAGGIAALLGMAMTIVFEPRRAEWFGVAAALVIGLAFGVIGMWRLGSYRMFVAWRYLLNHPPRVNPILGVLLLLALMVWWRSLGYFGVGLDLANYQDWRFQLAAGASLLLILANVLYLLRHSKPALYVFLGAIALVAVTSTLSQALFEPPRTPFDDPEGPLWLLRPLIITSIGAVVVAALALFFGSLRAIFTFFTTVPIGGVWIGTSALVCVLAVMSGFETDLRDKILGSNAHIQITREDGEFLNWREAKARVDNIPGVVASTPYAVSEVVIAANNNGMNVIIKGIDPETVGKVTDLIADLEDPEAIGRMQPLVDDTHDRTVPQQPKKPDVLDPPPDDMPGGGDPIDFSKPAPSDDDDDDTSSTDDARPDDSKLGTYGGDAPQIVGMQDPPPADMLTTDEPPIDYSEPDAVDGDSMRVIDIPLEPSLSRRTQALPGILVGRELVKQTHLYTGEEVRVVSPLSDPANPDATGTPIPFNRDYRVAGVFYTGMYEYDLKYVYVTLDSLQDFLVRGDAVDGIEIRIEDADETGDFIPQIRSALGPGYRIVDWRELNRSLFSALKLEKIAMFLVLGIVILVASFSIVGNLIMVVVEKGREIALLKTLGASDAGVMQLFAIQGLLIGVIGTVLGVLTGLVACWAGKNYGVPLNPDVYYIDKLPIHVDPESVIAAAAAGVVISIAATFYPAMLAARVRPATGLRH